MSWLIKSAKIAFNKKSTEIKYISYHGFFSPARAKAYGFYDMQKINGEQIHITDIVDFDRLSELYKFLEKDAIYVGAVRGDYTKVKPGTIPIVNGTPIDLHLKQK
jgi:hypothetical protein